jgi:hypothetical protein
MHPDIRRHDDIEFCSASLGFGATCLAVLHLFDARGTLHGEGALKLTERGSRSVLAFAAHYFFSMFVLGTTCMATEASVFLDSVGGGAKTERLVCFGGLVALTIVFFI